MSQSPALLSITVWNTVYVYKNFVRIRTNQCRRLFFFSSILTVTPPFSSFPPGITASTVTVRETRVI